MIAKPKRGFALVVFLTLMPVVAMLAWTFLQVGSGLRARASKEERRVRYLHAAEGGIRAYLTTGRQGSYLFSGCDVSVVLNQGTLTSSVRQEGATNWATTVTLTIDRGFVMQRRTNEEE